MKILVEASAATDQGAGIGRYAREILSRLISQNPDHEFRLWRFPAKVGSSSRFSVDSYPNASMTTFPVSRRNADRMYFRLRVPLDIRFGIGRGDVVYSPDFTAPPAFGLPRMITIHDLAFLTHPETTTPGLQGYLSTVVPRQAEQASLIAVNSLATRDDVVRLLGIPEERLVYIPLAVGEEFFAATSPTVEQRRRLGLPDDYALMLGTIEPRKNHVNSLRAYEMSGLGPSMPLVVAGRPGWGFDEAMSEISRLSDTGVVRYLDYVPEDDLYSLIAGARTMVYPSWTEGFGLPIAEALAAGVPVATTDRPVFREIGTEYARYANPADPSDIARAIREAVDDGLDDQRRRERAAWIRTFSWDSSTSIVSKSLKSLTSMA